MRGSNPRKVNRFHHFEMKFDVHVKAVMVNKGIIGDRKFFARRLVVQQKPAHQLALINFTFLTE